MFFCTTHGEMAMTPSHENLPSSNRSRISARIRRLAFVRIVLGTGQIMGATVSVILLLQTGVNGLSLSATAITGLLVLISSLIFRSGKAHSFGKTSLKE